MSENTHKEAEAEIARLQEQVERLERRLLKFETLAEAAQQAFIWDHTVYKEVPDDQWLAIDRADCERLLRALAELDRWRPWKTVLLESRLSGQL